MYLNDLSIFGQENNKGCGIKTKSFNIADYYLQYRTQLIQSINEFDCENHSMNLYLRDQAIEDALSFREEGCTTIIVNEFKEVYGYYTIVPSQIVLSDDDVCPCLHISRLATLKDIQGQGLGIKLVKDILNLAKQVGYRFVTLDSVPSKVLWYLKRDFIPFEAFDMDKITTDATNIDTAKDLETSNLVYMYQDLIDNDILKDFYAE